MEDLTLVLTTSQSEAECTKKVLQLTSGHVSNIILGIQGFKHKQHFELSLEMINNCLKKKDVRFWESG